ncbi:MULTISPECIES: hypothetical protein [unclassified Undibacterium]|uniref:hypothetical protein n=1 Tax=Undibacterium TaxID=401469 RepID=UPI003BF338CC
MSMVLWIKLDSDSDDMAPDDLGYLLDELEDIDAQCEELGVQPLSEFVDYSDVEYNMSEDDLDESWLAENAKWVNPTELLTSIRALEAALTESGDNNEVLEELQIILLRCIEAENKAAQVRLIAVM